MHLRMILLALLGTALTAQGQSCLTCASDTCQSCYQLAPVQITREALSSDALHQAFYQTPTAPSTEEIIARLPGLSLIRRGAYAQEPAIRGLGNNRVTLTLDGMRIFQACTDNMDPVSSYVEPNNLEAIQVQAGAGGGKMGSTTGGGIDFRLKQPVLAEDTNWNAYSSLRINHNAPGLALRGGVARQGPRLAVESNLVFRQQANYRLPSGEPQPFTQFQKTNYSLAFRFQSSARGEWQLKLLGDQARNVGYAALPMDVALADAWIGGLSYQRTPTHPAWLSWEGKLYHNRVNHVMDDSQRDSVAMRMDMPGQTRTTGAYWQSRWLLGLDHLLTAKVDAYSQESYAEMTMYPKGEAAMFMLTWPQVRSTALGLYVHDRWQFRPRWQLATEARLELVAATVQSDLGLLQTQIFYPEFDGSSLLPAGNVQAALSGTLTSRWRLVGKLAIGQRTPTVSEQFGYYLFNRLDGYDYLGNPNLRPERVWQSEASLSYQTTPVDLQLTGFLYQFSDYIQARTMAGYAAMTIGAAGVRRYENIPAASLSGGEIQVAWRMSRHFALIANGQYTLGLDHKGTPLPLIPPLQFQGAFRYEWQNRSIQVEGQWNAAQHRINPAFGEDRTEGFFLLHLRVSQPFTVGQYTFSLDGGVENLFNALYWQHLDWGNLPRPGRNFFLTLSMRVGS